MRRSIFMFSLGTLVTCLAQATDYDWKPVQRGEAIGGLSATGHVVPQDGALNIESARVQGRVLTILRREGELVNDGTPLFGISSSECFSLSEEMRVASSKQLPELLEGVQKREKQLGLRLQAGQCFVVASHSGVLTKRSLESGSSFNLGDPMATVLDVKRLTIELDITERDQAQLKLGQKVSFQFASNPGEIFQSKIQNIVPTIDLATRTSRVRLASIKLPTNISLDALVFGDIETGKHESILRVPASALVFSHNQQYVVIGGDGQAVSVPVQVVSEFDSLCSVRTLKDGTLHEGDKVATREAIFLFKKLSLENAK